MVDQSEHYITLAQYLQGRATVPSRWFSLYTPEIEKNAKELLSRINPFLEEINAFPVSVVSGWRPQGYNNLVKGAARSSYHIKGMAVDLLDDAKGSLDSLILQNPKLLEKYGLWLESPVSTPKWTHLDIGDRPERPLRVFLP